MLPPTGRPESSPLPPPERPDPSGPDPSDARFSGLMAQFVHVPTAQRENLSPKPKTPKETTQGEELQETKTTVKEVQALGKAPLQGPTESPSTPTPPQVANAQQNPLNSKLPEIMQRPTEPPSFLASPQVANAQQNPLNPELPETRTPLKQVSPLELLKNPTNGEAPKATNAIPLPTHQSLPQIAVPTSAIESQALKPVAEAMKPLAESFKAPPLEPPATESIPTEQPKIPLSLSKPTHPNPVLELPVSKGTWTPSLDSPKELTEILASISKEASQTLPKHLSTPSQHPQGHSEASPSMAKIPLPTHGDAKPTLSEETPYTIHHEFSIDSHQQIENASPIKMLPAPTQHAMNSLIPAPHGVGQAPKISPPPLASSPSQINLPSPALAAISQVEGSLKWMLRGDRQEARLQLYPESLGQVSIHLRVEGGEVHARLWVTEPTAIQLIQEGRPHLESALKQQGLHLGTFDLQQGQGQFRQAMAHPSPSSFFLETTRVESTRQEEPIVPLAVPLKGRHIEIYA